MSMLGERQTEGRCLVNVEVEVQESAEFKNDIDYLVLLKECFHVY